MTVDLFLHHKEANKQLNKLSKLLESME